jgi:hypothetical protein
MYAFPHFGMLCPEDSGNPGTNTSSPYSDLTKQSIPGAIVAASTLRTRELGFDFRHTFIFIFIILIIFF